MSRSPSNATALEQLRRQEMMAHNAPIIAGKSVIPGGSVIPGQERLQQLMPYSACDISDALLQLEPVEEGQVAMAGFLEGLVPLGGEGRRRRKVIAPASTVQFQPKAPQNGEFSNPMIADSNIQPGKQWSDLTVPNTVVVVQQPEGQRCAAVGGIHATAMARLRARGLVVGGRVRDVEELQKLDLPTWSYATSTVGVAAEAKAYATQVPITISGVAIEPGDIIFCDPAEGVVRIPADLLERVIHWLQARHGAEERVKRFVAGGGSVQEAFERFR